MAIERGSGEIRNLVMQEVTRQIGPLVERLSVLGNNIERLYNTNGGPPGYLQSARAEDNERFKMIFNILEDLGPIKDFVRDHEAKEEETARQLALQVKASEWRSNRNLGIATLILAALSLLKGCAPALKAMMAPDPHAAMTQDSQIPTVRR